MTKLLLIVISLICFPVFSWAGDAFLISGQSVGGEHPTPDVRVYYWQKGSDNLKLEDDVKFPSSGIGGIYQLGMQHNQRLFTAIGGWSADLNKAPLTTFKFHNGKVIKHHYMVDLNRYFEFYFHESGKIALQLDGPLGKWKMIDPDAEDKEEELIENKSFDFDSLIGGSVYSQSLGDGIVVWIDVDVDGSPINHWSKNVSKSFKLVSPPIDFINSTDKQVSILENNFSSLIMGGFGVKDKKNNIALIVWDKLQENWTYNWIPARPPILSRVMKDYVVFQVLKGELKGGVQPQTGDFIFYNIAKNVMFRAHVGEDSEVFDIDEEGWVLYRSEDTLYKAQIQKDSLGKPIKLVTDPAIKTVHWGLWAEKDTAKKVEPIVKQQLESIGSDSNQ